jgi:hypothetical protein
LKQMNEARVFTPLQTKGSFRMDAATHSDDTSSSSGGEYEIDQSTQNRTLTKQPSTKGTLKMDVDQDSVVFRLEKTKKEQVNPISRVQSSVNNTPRDPPVIVTPRFDCLMLLFFTSLLT